MANFPASLDTTANLPNPAGTNTTNSPDHAAQHSVANDAIRAVEIKLGIGAATPLANRLLTATGTGTSDWSKVAPTGTIVGTSDTQVLTSKTLTAPAINGGTIDNATVTVDAVAGHTTPNTGTIYGIPVTSARLAAGSVASGATQAITATSETTASASFVDLATVGPTVTVTIGLNGLALVSIYCALRNATAGGYATMGFAVSGASTQVAAANFSIANLNPSDSRQSGTFLLTGLTPGSTTFTAKYGSVVTGTSTFADRRIVVVPL